LPRYDTFTLILFVILFLAVVITVIESLIRKSDKPQNDVKPCRLCRAPVTTDVFTPDTLCVVCRDDLDSQSMESKR